TYACGQIGDEIEASRKYAQGVPKKYRVIADSTAPRVCILPTSDVDIGTFAQLPVAISFICSLGFRVAAMAHSLRSATRTYQRRNAMARGSKASYTDKQKRQ